MDGVELINWNIVKIYSKLVVLYTIHTAHGFICSRVVLKNAFFEFWN